jgi:hypothetical protein
MSRASRGPDFLCIGQQKAGTAFLYDLLKNNKHVWLPPVKEMHFFTESTNFSPKKKKLYRKVISPKSSRKDVARISDRLRKEEFDDIDIEFFRRYLKLSRKMTYENYCDCFALKGELTSGDITPAYSTLPKAKIAEIHGYLPDIPVILIVRHPVDRFWSQFNQALRRFEHGRGGLKSSSSEVDNIRSFLKTGPVAQRSYPSKIYNRWSSIYPKSQILVVPFEALTRETETAIVEINDFLDIPSDYRADLSDVTNKKQSDKKIPMSDDAKAFLYDYFADEVRACQDLFGEKCKAWRVA